jgi:opacity protein-like surface antigen
VFHFKGAYFSAKVMAGTAHINVPPNHQGSGNYFAFAPGGTVDFRIRPRLFARVGYEYQIWPGFKGDAPNGSGGLTPNGFSAGLSYAVIR